MFKFTSVSGDGEIQAEVLVVIAECDDDAKRIIIITHNYICKLFIFIMVCWSIQKANKLLL